MVLIRLPMAAQTETLLVEAVVVAAIGQVVLVVLTEIMEVLQSLLRAKVVAVEVAVEQ